MGIPRARSQIGAKPNNTLPEIHGAEGEGFVKKLREGVTVAPSSEWVEAKEEAKEFIESRVIAVLGEGETASKAAPVGVVEEKRGKEERVDGAEESEEATTTQGKDKELKHKEGGTEVEAATPPVPEVFTS